MSRREIPRTHLRLDLVLIALVILPWFSSFGGVFVFDDDKQILHSEIIDSFSPLTKFTSAKRPLVELSLAANFAISGTETWSYHLFNILVHLACVLLLRRLLTSIFAAMPGLPARFPPPRYLAFAVALLWGVHPVQTESVTYIVQRAESMGSLGYLGAIWFWLRAREAERPWPSHLGAALCAWFGMMSKSIVVTLPVALLLIDFYFRPGGKGFDLRTTWKGWVLVASAWAFPFMSGLVTGATRGVHGGRAALGFTLKDFGPREYLMSQASCILDYLRLVLVPLGLCLDHGRAPTTSIMAAFLPGLAVLSLLMATGLAIWKRRPAGLAFGFFFLVLAPSSSIIPIRDIFVEHRIYLAMVGPLGLFIVLSASWLPTDRIRLAALAAVFITFGTLTHVRNLDYHDARGMWDDVVAKRPENPRGHYTLGVFEAQKGDYDAAIKQAEEALRLDPEYELALVLVASSEIRLGRFAAAEEAARRAIALDPKLPIAYTNLGDALEKQGRFEESVAAHRAAILAKKKFPKPHVDLAEVLVRVGRIDEAEKSLADGFERGAAIYPSAWQLQGVIHRRRGRIDDAIESYRRALALNAWMPEVHLNLAIALQATGAYEEALTEAQATLKIQPDSLRGLLAEAALATLCGRFEEALSSYEEAKRVFADGRPGITFPAARELELARARVAALPRHASVVGDQGPGLDAAELALHAEIAAARGERDLVLRLVDRAFELDPTLASDLERPLRFMAARAAADLAQTERSGAALEHALDCLEADLRLREQQLGAGGAEAEGARSVLAVWKADRLLRPLWSADNDLPLRARRLAFAAHLDALLATP